MAATALWVFQRPNHRDGVKDALERAGFEVRMSDENLAALEAFQRARPSVVVIEVPFPDTERLELCQVLKATPQGSNTPVLVVTGVEDGMSYRAQAIHQYDADEFVHPFDPSRIAAACKRWVERSRQPRTTPPPHQAALEDALDRLDTLLDEDVIAPAGVTSAPAVARHLSAALQNADPLKESLEELSRMSDELVDRLPLEARADTVEQRPPSASPKDIARLQQTLEELERLVEDDDDVMTSSEVQVAGDRGEDIQAHLDTMFERSEGQADAPARNSTDLFEAVELFETANEAADEDADEIVTVESEELHASELERELAAAQPSASLTVSREEARDVLAEIADELDLHDEEPVADALPAAALRKPAHEPWSPSPIDTMPAPAHREHARRWPAAATVILALVAGAGIFWMLVAGKKSEEASTAPPPAAAAVAEVAQVEPQDAPPPSPIATRREPPPPDRSSERAAIAAEPKRSKPSVEPVRERPAATSTGAKRSSAAPRSNPTSVTPPRAIEATREATSDRVVPPPPPRRVEPVTEEIAHATTPPASQGVREAAPFAGPEKTGMDLEAGRASDVSPMAPATPSVTPPPATPLPNTTPFAVAPPPREELPSVAIAEPPPPPPIATAPKRPEPPKPAPVLVPPRLKNRAEPAYPARARKAGPVGTIVLDVLVDEHGNPVRVVVKEGLGNADLESAAIHAVLRSSFEPAREGDKPVRGWTTERFPVKP